MKKIILIFVAICLYQYCNSQAQHPIYSVEASGHVGSGNYAPFWFSANKYGIYSLNNSQGLVRVSAIKNHTKKIDYYYGIDIIDRVDKKNNLFFQQAYVGTKLYCIHLKGGLKEDFYGNQDSLLSIGGTPWSTNAMPIPQIYVGIPDFIYVPFTKKFLEIKGGISHGWLGEKDQFVKNAFLHSKYFVGRLGPEKLKLQLGLYHTAQWGGISPIDGKLPSSFKDFLTVFQVEGDNVGPAVEKIGYLGNHLASYQAAVEVFTKTLYYNLYYQSFLEDKNGRIGIDWKNKPDMILGISIKNNNSNSLFQKALIEYIHTSNQSGDPLKSGDDNYYNNDLYNSGWTYRNMTIGTPLITSPAYFHKQLSSEYYDKHYILNNKVIALNFGAIGKLNDNFLTLRLTISKNYGDVTLPFDHVKNQVSSYLGYLYNFKKYNNILVQTELGYDNGDLLGNNFGIRCSVKKTF